MTDPIAMLFDLDGTLIHSSGDIAAAINEMLSTLGFQSASLEEVESWIGHGLDPLIHRSITRDHDGQVDEELLGRALDIFRPAYLATNFENTVLADGARRVLDVFCATGFPCAIVTNKPRTPTIGILEKFNLMDRFQTVMCGDTLDVRKPDPAPLRHALDACGSTKGWMIGDSDVDSAASAAAGLPFIGIHGGYGRDNDPAEFPCAPELMLESLSELLDENECPLEMLCHPPGLS